MGVTAGGCSTRCSGVGNRKIVGRKNGVDVGAGVSVIVGVRVGAGVSVIVGVIVIVGVKVISVHMFNGVKRAYVSAAVSSDA